MKDSVTALLCYQEKICVIERATHLNSFPGYHSFPGGKIDEEDEKTIELPSSCEPNFSKLPQNHFWALTREIEEELGIDLKVMNIGKVTALGFAETPAFNPYRFNNYFYLIELLEPAQISPDKGEIAAFTWQSAQEFLNEFNQGKILAVPPTIMVMRELASRSDLFRGEQLRYRLEYDEKSQIPCIESVFGVKQFLPLSNTFPPAMRTNCFLIGDAQASRVLIDPSPKNAQEYQKLLVSLKDENIDIVFITHHHPDHHEFAAQLAKEKSALIKISEDSFRRIQKKWGENYFEDCSVDLVQEGDVLTQWLGEEVSLIALPGHDKGLLGLAPRSLKWMIVSDLIQTVGTVVVGDEEGDMREYFDSLQKVIALKPRVLFPSHGIAVGGVDKCVETLHHRMAREEQIKKYLKQSLSFDEIVSLIYKDLPERLIPYARLTVQAHLKKIQDELS